MTRPMGPQPPAWPPTRPGSTRPGIRDGSFTDRVMSQVAAEPRPTPIRVFVRSILRLHLRSAAAAMRTAVRLAFVPSAGASGTLRARSLALVLAFVFFAGLSGPLAGAGLLGLLRPDGETMLPVVGAPSQIPLLASPSPIRSPSPSPTLEPVAKATPKRTPKATPKPTVKKKLGTSKAGKTPKRTPKPRPKGSTREDRDDRNEQSEPREPGKTERPEDPDEQSEHEDD